MSLWIFGYGSLIWRPDFPHLRAVPAVARGYVRRLDQGSPDHRGTPSQPGRVATLVEAPGQVCEGIAYEVAPSEQANVLTLLDHRERGGYVRAPVALHRRDDRAILDGAITYVADATNRWYLGPTSTEAMVEQVRLGHGESGSNVEYVLRLARALRAHAIHDEHVFALEHALALPAQPMSR